MMQDPVVLHVLVVGFHHKKGCQVEYAFPPLCPDGPEAKSLELPEPWKHLPSLALPDGAHNYQKDTIYFHLPALDGSRQTVFGVSCFRQISSECLKNRSEDITRGSVQKSVCVLSLLPLYGLIQTKLELITHAYFEERDFSQVTLLEDTYRHLNATLTQDQLWGSQLFLGLSVRDLILQFKHKVLVLFKLLLLERRVLFYKSPVEELCTTILTICSLFPGMLEKGLSESTTALGNKQKMLEMNKNSVDMDSIQVTFPADTDKTDIDSTNRNGSSQNDDVLNSSRTNMVKRKSDHVLENQKSNQKEVNSVYNNLESNQVASEPKCTVNRVVDNPSVKSRCLSDRYDTKTNDCSQYADGDKGTQDVNLNLNVGGSHVMPCDVVENTTSIEDELLKEIDELLPNGTARSSGRDDVDDSEEDLSILANLDLCSCGMPLSVFAKGSVCLPYLSLPFIECLNGLTIRSCLVGATNVLFKQKRNLFDVIVEIDGAKIDVFDVELSKQLNLTMEDLRFAENLVQHVTGEQKDVFLDGTGWEGGDEWLRGQFRLYLLSLLRTADANVAGSRDLEAFNQSFVQALQETHNFKAWQSNRDSYQGLLQTEPRHPYQKPQITMADMKLKFSHSIQSTEKGRKINQAVTSTGKAVMQTGRAVGGALTSAKSFMSSWLSSANSPNALPQTSPTVEKSPEVEMKGGLKRGRSFKRRKKEQNQI